MASERTIVAMDIGTATVRAAVASISKDEGLMIESISERQSDGVKNGTIVNIDQTLKVINSVISDVEMNAGMEVRSVILGVGGEQIEGIESSGVVGIKNKNFEIKREDINKSIEVARARDIPKTAEVLHTLVQDFKVDSRDGIRDPIDMLGHRLDTKVFIVTASSSVCQNLKKCVQKAGIQVQRMVLGSLADSEAVLKQEEKEAGALVINIGAGVTNAICFLNGAPHYVGGIPLGADNITSDLAYMFQIPRSYAETLKLSSGCCFTPSCRSGEFVIIPAVGGKASLKIPKKEFAKIIEARMAEIFTMINNKMENAGINGALGSGIILTGGGALLSGASELAAEVFALPATIGFPDAIKGLDRTYINPEYTVLLGLLALESRKYIENAVPTASSQSDKGLGGRMKGLFSRLF